MSEFRANYTSGDVNINIEEDVWLQKGHHNLNGILSFNHFVGIIYCHMLPRALAFGMEDGQYINLILQIKTVGQNDILSFKVKDTLLTCSTFCKQFNDQLKYYQTV